MRNKLSKFLVLLPFLISFYGFSSNINTSNIYYECNDDGTYDVTLEVFTECSDGSNELSAQAILGVKYSSEKLGIDKSLSVSRVENLSNQWTSLRCQKSEAQTGCSSAGTERGIYKHVYKGTLNLGGFGETDDWILSFARNSRTTFSNYGIDSGNIPFYTSTTLNTTVGCNSSPIFSGNNFVSVFKACINKTEEFDLGLVDADNDELRFRFETPKASTNTSLSYQSGFSATSPISGNMSISSDGKLILSATELNERNLTTLVIEEFRNGVKIGEIKRDIQIETFDCSNTPPIISDFENGTTKFQICEGASLDQRISKNDADGDNTAFIMSSKSDGAPSIFSTSDGRFRGNMISSFVGTHTYTIGVRDDACPYPDTVFKTFTLEVVPLPSFNLGEESLLNCNLGKEYAPTVEGKKPFTYMWYDQIIENGIPKTKNELTNSNSSITIGESSLTIKSLDNHTQKKFYLQVTDSIGCTRESSAILNSSIITDFDLITRCIDDSTDFYDKTKFINSAAVKYNWDFGNSAVNTNLSTREKINPIVLYPTTGNFNVSLSVTDSLGCTDTYSKSIAICSHPQDVGYERLDSCSLERYNGHRGVLFMDKTNYDVTPCGRENLSAKVFIKNPTTSAFESLAEYEFGNASSFKIMFDSAGTYRVSMKTVTEAKCVDSVFTDFVIHPRPTITLTQNNIYKNCNAPDTTLSAVLDSIEVGTGQLKYEWTSTSTLPDAIKAQSDSTLQDSSWAIIGHVDDKDRDLGTYFVNVIDSFECSYRLETKLLDPLTSDFRYEQVCALGDTMKFREQAILSHFKIVKWEWKFGDTEFEIDSIDNNISHVYRNPNDYQVTLTLEDSTGCRDSRTHTVYNSFPIVDSFYVNPVLATAFCKNGEIDARGFYLIDSIPNHVDTISWTWSGKTNIYIGNNIPKGYKITDQKVPTNVDSLRISYSIRYNSHPEMDIFTSCPIDTTPTPIRVNEELNARFSLTGNCTGDKLAGKFTQLSKSPITSWEWEIRNKNTNTATKDFTPNANPIINTNFAYEVDVDQAQKGYDLYFSATDSNGCYRNFEKVASKDIKYIKPINFSIIEDFICFGENITLEASEIDDGTARDNLDRYIITNESNNSQIISRDDPNKFLNFVPQDPITNNFLKENNDNSLSLKNEGENIIRLYLFKVNFEGNDTTRCGKEVYDTVTVYPAPKLTFSYDTVCSGENVTLKNSSKGNSGDNITNWEWTLPNGTISNENSPTFTVKQGGNQDISLKVTMESGCQNDIKLDTSVYFYHTPIADFIVDTENLEAFSDLPFQSTASIGGGNDEFIKHEVSIWDLGDGTIKTGETIDHSYDKIDIYSVKYSAISNKECRHDTTKTINLNTYLNVPNAFSPNGDGENDEFGLIYKEITELQEFKIYNRWGELVFDGGNNPDAKWNGKFRGVDQEIGVYILYVKGTGAYDVEYNFKENITLIR